MICTVCGEPATLMLRSAGMDHRSVAVVLAWAEWDEIAGGEPAPESLFCAPHAGERLAKLPLLAPVASTGAAEGDVYTHG